MGVKDISLNEKIIRLKFRGGRGYIYIWFFICVFSVKIYLLNEWLCKLINELIIWNGI